MLISKVAVSMTLTTTDCSQQVVVRFASWGVTVTPFGHMASDSEVLTPTEAAIRLANQMGLDEGCLFRLFTSLVEGEPEPLNAGVYS
jgi:hypothetical protein